MKTIIKSLFTLLVGAMLIFPGLAYSATGEEDATSSAETEMVVESVNSFEMFWPLVAGKTKGDSLYFLKRLKETGRGWLIFGKTQKFDYKIFLAAKRTLEGEKLLNDGKGELANETFQSSLNELVKAEKLDLKGQSISEDTNNRLVHINTLSEWLTRQHEGSKELLEQIVNKSSSLQAK